MKGLGAVLLTTLAAGSMGVTLPIQETAPKPRTIVIGATAAPRLALASCLVARGDAQGREACAALTEVLRGDIEFEGLFEVVTGAGDLEVETRVEAESDRLVVETIIRTVASGQILLGRRYPGRADAPWAIAHRIADDITALTQYRGVATSRIAFVSDRDAAARNWKDIYFVDYDGHDLFRYSRGGLLNILPAWSPDGQSLAFVAFAPAPDIVVTPFKGARLNITQGKGQSFSPAWSPDGEHIAYASSRSGEAEIWVSDRDGGQARQLTWGAAPAAAPCWSPTGQDIAYTSGRTGAPQTWLVDADGLNLRKLPAPGAYQDAPAFNPAKEYHQIAFASRVEKGRLQVSVFTLPEGPVRAVSDPSTSCESPSWAPNGRHLVFSCEMADGRQLVVIDREGRVQRTLTSGHGNNEQPDWGP